MTQQIKLFNSLVILTLSLCLISSCQKEKMEPEPEDLRDQYLGSFRMEEQCDTGNDTYTITITKEETGLEVFNLFGAGKRSDATVYSDGTLNISGTNLGRSGNCPVAIKNASGYLRNNTLYINFSIRTRDNTIECFNNSDIDCSAIGQ